MPGAANAGLEQAAASATPRSSPIAARFLGGPLLCNLVNDHTSALPRGVAEGQGIAMLTNRYFAALAFVGFLFAASAGGSSPAAAQGCGPWNNWCMPQCGEWNNQCAQECGPWNNYCQAQCGGWNNWCRGVCGPWNGFCAQQAYGPGPGWAPGWRPYAYGGGRR